MRAFRFLKFSVLAATALLFASCYYYDPYYSGEAGYSDSYAYTGGGTTFVYTSSSRWFYDPGVCCYYDRYRSCYYDPWIGGYYPRNYCPRPIYNCPRPYGWNGRGACPTPRNVNGRQIDRYQDRIGHMKQKNYSWANKVRERTDSGVSNWQGRQAKNAASFAKKSPPTGGRANPASRNSSQANSTARRSQGSQQSAPSIASRRTKTNQASPQSRSLGQSRTPSRAQSSPTQSRQSRPAPKQPSRPTAPPSRSSSRPGYNQPVSAPSRAQPSRTTSQPQARSSAPRASNQGAPSSRNRGSSGGRR